MTPSQTVNNSLSCISCPECYSLPFFLRPTPHPQAIEGKLPHSFFSFLRSVSSNVPFRLSPYFVIGPDHVCTASDSALGRIVLKTGVFRLYVETSPVFRHPLEVFLHLMPQRVLLIQLLSWATAIYFSVLPFRFVSIFFFFFCQASRHQFLSPSTPSLNPLQSLSRRKKKDPCSVLLDFSPVVHVSFPAKFPFFSVSGGVIHLTYFFRDPLPTAVLTIMDVLSMNNLFCFLMN